MEVIQNFLDKKIQLEIEIKFKDEMQELGYL